MDCVLPMMEAFLFPSAAHRKSDVPFLLSQDAVVLSTVQSGRGFQKENYWWCTLLILVLHHTCLSAANTNPTHSYLFLKSFCVLPFPPHFSFPFLIVTLIRNKWIFFCVFLSFSHTLCIYPPQINFLRLFLLSLAPHPVVNPGSWSSQMLPPLQPLQPSNPTGFNKFQGQ